MVPLGTDAAISATAVIAIDDATVPCGNWKLPTTSPPASG